MLSRLVRRTHMYLALFLFPWMLMYAVSTLAMNHRGLFAQRYGEGPVPFLKERELVYEGTFPDAGDANATARQLLVFVGLDGAHTVSKGRDGAIVITRQDLLAPRRLTYSPATRILSIERMVSRQNALLERFHRRRGYATGYAVDTAWAVSVDLVIAAMVIWVASGLWMWWEMKVTRAAGALAIAGGAGLFAAYLLVL